MTEVVFHQPVLVGDVVSFYASVTRIGNTSITVHVDVEAERWRKPGEAVKVTEADIVYVNLDENREADADPEGLTVSPRPEPAGRAAQP